MADEPFAVIAGVVSIHGNPFAFVSVVFRPDHRMELGLPLGAAEYAATCSAPPPSTRPFNGATLLSTGWGSWRSRRQEFTAVPYVGARTQFARNLESYPSAAAAERGGYRPCFRCRPETAPFCPAWEGTKTTVERALALISAEPFLTLRKQRWLLQSLYYY
jgi:hypothetical protein